MSDTVETLATEDDATAAATTAAATTASPGVPSSAAFARSAVEGPFGFKPDRNRPIEPHFDGFGRLTPDQAREVLDVRDGRRPRCLLHLPTESVLFEHAGQGYCDPVTGQQWGYHVRRAAVAGPPRLAAAPPAGAEPAAAEVPIDPPPVEMPREPAATPIRRRPAGQSAPARAPPAAAGVHRAGPVAAPGPRAARVRGGDVVGRAGRGRGHAATGR